jgi:GTP cyclohydrolase II
VPEFETGNSKLGTLNVRVTLTFAQSLDGCLTARPGQPTALSSPEAMRHTHVMRSSHDAILVGIGTVLADNPRLSVRLVAGSNPQPVVLDASLRLPATCALVAAPVRPLWVVCDLSAPQERRQLLEERGVRVLRADMSAQHAERWPAILAVLEARGIETLMVEGGAQVITSLLAAGLAQKLIVTIAPRLLAGLHAVQPVTVTLPELRNVRYRQLGVDMLLEADLAQA